MDTLIEGLENNEDIASQRLQEILDKNRDKRIVVLGTTCTGKSTLTRKISNARDMDEEVFPLLTKEEAEYVCQTPWTPEIGETMERLVREKVKAEAGKPLFGTVLVDCDLVIYLKISDELLRQRTVLRNSSLEDAKNMQKAIEEEIQNSDVSAIEFAVG